MLNRVGSWKNWTAGAHSSGLGCPIRQPLHNLQWAVLFQSQEVNAMYEVLLCDYWTQIPTFPTLTWLVSPWACGQTCSAGHTWRLTTAWSQSWSYLPSSSQANKPRANLTCYIQAPGQPDMVMVLEGFCKSKYRLDKIATLLSFL